MSDDRGLDIVVFGATGFVGRLVAGYLAEHAPDGVRIGLAGRSEERLAQTRSRLGPVASGWPLVVADSGDEQSLASMARGARVVATTVGPYRGSGMRLVDACIAAGTDYADLTGEVLFAHDRVIVPTSSDATDSAVSSTPTTSPQHDETEYWHPSGARTATRRPRRAHHGHAAD
jgi:short subunit dehydrogenase-like uncharacterized protein